MADSEENWSAMWDLFDSSKSGLSKTDFIRVARVLGRRYTDEQFAEKLSSLPDDKIPFPSFMTFMREPYSGPTEDDVVSAMRAFDGKETGEMSSGQLSTVLTTMGAKMTNEEAIAVLKNIPFPESGSLPHAAIAKALNVPVPSARPDVEKLFRTLMVEEAAKFEAEQAAKAS